MNSIFCWIKFKSKLSSYWIEVAKGHSNRFNLIRNSIGFRFNWKDIGCKSVVSRYWKYAHHFHHWWLWIFLFIFNSKDIDSKRHFPIPSKSRFQTKIYFGRTRLLVDPTTHQVKALPFIGLWIIFQIVVFDEIVWNHGFSNMALVWLYLKA